MPKQDSHSLTLGGYKTQHEKVESFTMESVADFNAIREDCAAKGRDFVIMGSGSNIFFSHKHPRSVVIRNRLPHEFAQVGDELFFFSSAQQINRLLRFAVNDNRDAPYYLTSVPATIGGAIAMNAGRGREHNKSIFDFVQSVRALRNGEVCDIPKAEIAHSFRRTDFTGLNSELILGATFHLPRVPAFETNPMTERLNYARSYQHIGAKSCGSVFAEFNPRILRRLMGLRMLGAEFSPRTLNWINNHSSSPLGVHLLLRLATGLHRAARRPYRVELILVR